MTLSARQQAIVSALLEARRLGQPWPPEAYDASLDLDDAYAVQAGVAQALGWFPEGPRAWKVGGTALVTAAPLPELLTSPATWPAAAQPDWLIEAELAFRLARTPTGPADLLDCLGTVCVSIELIGTRLAGGLQAPTAWKIADQSVHAGLVIGPERPYAEVAGFGPADWAAQACRIDVNGQTRAQGQGGHPSGDPLATLPWLLAHAAAHATAHTGGLRAGDLVTTGAWLVATVRAGDEVVVSFNDLGQARLLMTA